MAVTAGAGPPSAAAVSVLVALPADCRVAVRAGYDIGAAGDGELYAFAIDRSGPLLCAPDARGLADAILADISGVRR